jgi:two-component system cell cycle response regulator CpdR
MSGHEHQLERAQGLNELVHKVVSKPFTIAAICTVVEDALAKKKK